MRRQAQQERANLSDAEAVRPLARQLFESDPTELRGLLRHPAGARLLWELGWDTPAIEPHASTGPTIVVQSAFGALWEIGMIECALRFFEAGEFNELQALLERMLTDARTLNDGAAGGS